MRYIIFTFILSIAFCWAFAQEVFFQGNWDEAFQQAKEQNKLVLVDFYADWCLPCKVMDQTVFQDKDVLMEMSNYVSLKVSVDTNEGRIKATEYDVQQIPTVILFDAEENLLSQLLGLQTASSFVKELKKQAKKGMN